MLWVLTPAGATGAGTSAMVWCDVERVCMAREVATEKQDFVYSAASKAEAMSPAPPA